MGIEGQALVNYDSHELWLQRMVDPDAIQCQVWDHFVVGFFDEVFSIKTAHCLRFFITPDADVNFILCCPLNKAV